MFVCNRCSESWPATGFYWRKDGSRNPWCKACYKADYAANREAKKASVSAWRTKRYDRKPVTFSCKWCGTLVSRTVGVNGRADYCSRPCKDKASKAAAAAVVLASKPTNRKCAHCGIVVPQAMRADAKFCSDACNSAAHAITRKHAKRAGRSRNPGDPLLLRNAIAVRDKFRCGLCGGRVDMALKHPDALFGSIDHIVPLSRGGTNDLANLQLAHLRCNLEKRDRGEQQLRLI